MLLALPGKGIGTVAGPHLECAKRLQGWRDTALRTQGSSVIALSPAYPSKRSSLVVMIMFSAWTASGNKEVWEVLPVSYTPIGALNSLV